MPDFPRPLRIATRKSLLALWQANYVKARLEHFHPGLTVELVPMTSRGDVRYVVTEYGTADLWGRSVRERAHSLIAIAHPAFRSELTAEAKHRHYVFSSTIG